MQPVGTTLPRYSLADLLHKFDIDCFEAVGRDEEQADIDTWIRFCVCSQQIFELEVMGVLLFDVRNDVV